MQRAARARGDHWNAPVKAKLLLWQLRQALDFMRPAAERLNELGGAHADPEPCADGSTHSRKARADERYAPGDASLVECCNSRPAKGARLLEHDKRQGALVDETPLPAADPAHWYEAQRVARQPCVDLERDRLIELARLHRIDQRLAGVDHHLDARLRVGRHEIGEHGRSGRLDPVVQNTETDRAG